MGRGMQIKWHAHNNWRHPQTDIALLPAVYLRSDTILDVQSWSIMLSWLRFSVGAQFMWRCAG